MQLKDCCPFFFVSQPLISLPTHLDSYSSLRIYKVPLKKKRKKLYSSSPTGDNIFFLLSKYVWPISWTGQREDKNIPTSKFTTTVPQNKHLHCSHALASSCICHLINQKPISTQTKWHFWIQPYPIRGWWTPHVIMLFFRLDQIGCNIAISQYKITSV